MPARDKKATLEESFLLRSFDGAQSGKSREMSGGEVGLPHWRSEGNKSTSSRIEKSNETLCGPFQLVGEPKLGNQGQEELIFGG